ncbi:MAG: N-acylglucosamine 2-epimerase [Eubacterium sp.]|nr:N-acylglucosamine 2-epimerase [Eubacterium sp.]
MEQFVNEIREHLIQKLIPFWEGLKDETNGGYYGYMGYGLDVDPTYEKGCILNSRILWFFSNADLLLGREDLRKAADHAYRFLTEHGIDRDYGGVYWSLAYDGKVLDPAKHTYNQAFTIYALSSYYDAATDPQALALAKQIRDLIEEKCADAYGYLESFDRSFQPRDNDKLSENGVLAEKTMNTLLHVFEAYTELYRVSPDEKTGARLRFMLDLFADRVYNPALGRQEVFFDKNWNTLLDLYSYGHDIEAAWLIDRGLSVLDDAAYTAKIAPITAQITENIYERAFDGHSLLNEAERGVPDPTRVWWVQAETVVGFINAWQKCQNAALREKWLDAARAVWTYIQNHLIDKRDGSEWFWAVDEYGKPLEKPIVEPWKCPYHNGRMCIEVIRRMGQ